MSACVWFVFGFVSGFAHGFVIGSCLDRIWFVSDSYLFRRYGSGLVRLFFGSCLNLDLVRI